MQQVEAVYQFASCSFGVGGVPFWGKLKAPPLETHRYQSVVSKAQHEERQHKEREPGRHQPEILPKRER